MKTLALMAALLATVTVGGCASYHQSHKDGVTGKDEAASRAAVYGSAEKTAKAHKMEKMDKVK